jgi:hypothetical protein
MKRYGGSKQRPKKTSDIETRITTGRKKNPNGTKDAIEKEIQAELD